MKVKDKQDLVVWKFDSSRVQGEQEKQKKEQKIIVIIYDN